MVYTQGIFFLPCSWLNVCDPYQSLPFSFKVTLYFSCLYVKHNTL